MSFKVIVDSCCDLTPSLLREDAFLSVPLSIRVGDRVFTDDAALDRPELLWQMQQSPEPPQAKASRYCAEQARQIWLEEHPETRIHIFNSCSASSGEVLLALKVRALAAAGLPFQKVVQEASRFCQDMQTLFVLESLETLRKNGRLSGVQSVVTAALRIKLLMGATPEGSICKRGQALSMKQALVKMAELMAADPGHQGRLLVLAHCDCLDRVFQFKDMIRARCGFSDILVCEAGGVSTVYANRGGIVAAY